MIHLFLLLILHITLHVMSREQFQGITRWRALAQIFHKWSHISYIITCEKHMIMWNVYDFSVRVASIHQIVIHISLSLSVTQAHVQHPAETVNSLCKSSDVYKTCSSAKRIGLCLGLRACIIVFLCMRFEQGYIRAKECEHLVAEWMSVWLWYTAVWHPAAATYALAAGALCLAVMTGLAGCN